MTCIALLRGLWCREGDRWSGVDIAWPVLIATSSGWKSPSEPSSRPCFSYLWLWLLIVLQILALITSRSKSQDSALWRLHLAVIAGASACAVGIDPWL